MTITIKFNNNTVHNYNSIEEILKIDNYDDIIYIYCAYENLSSLPKLPNSIHELWCSNNNLSRLPELPNSLINFNYYNNPVHTYIKTYFDGYTKKYFEYHNNIKKEFVNKIGNWFLDCKYNPKFLYCRKRLMKEYEELYN